MVERPLSAPSACGPGRVVARGLARSFGGHVALHPFDLDLGPGGVVGLLGPNGSGKSTLLRALTGLLRPDAGRAWVDGVALAGDGTGIRHRCTYAPGEIALYGEMTGGAHLNWLLRGRGSAATERARAIAAELELPLEKRVRAYSHGMKRQLLLAAALAPEVPVRILDEATEGLDPSKRGQVLALLTEDARAGTTILLSSHHLGEVDRVCDRLVFLNAGRKIAEETSATLAERARTLVRLTFAEGADLRGVVERLSRRTRAPIRVEGTRVDVRVEGADPRAFVCAALAEIDAPHPLAMRWGELSLSELYRDLYGVEGC
jgi:ABC-2 type transport system ATP-binding protein